MTDADRRARAAARRTSGMMVERMLSLDENVALHEASSIEARLAAMTRLCRAAWLATGRPLPPEGRAHRVTMPGEVYRTQHGPARRAP